MIPSDALIKSEIIMKEFSSQVDEGMSPNYTAIAHHCNLWRNYGDIQDSWASVLDIINFYGDNKDDFAAVAGPGNWNDPDMVELLFIS